MVINGEIREKSTKAPCLLSAIPIELEITQKAQMSANMFALKSVKKCIYVDVFGSFFFQIEWPFKEVQKKREIL